MLPGDRGSGRQVGPGIRAILSHDIRWRRKASLYGFRHDGVPWLLGLLGLLGDTQPGSDLEGQKATLAQYMLPPDGSWDSMEQYLLPMPCPAAIATKLRRSSKNK